MHCLVIGAAGQVGQEFARLLEPGAWTALTHEELDVTDPTRVRAALGDRPGDVVVNLAAFHNVNLCEEQPQTALAVNGLGALHVARAAAELGRKVVYFSSDYVFGADAARRTPYTEADAPAPLNVYGTSKVAGEQFVRQAAADHLIVRTSSLFGAVTSRKGWTFPETMLRRARAGEPLRVVRDQLMAPTYTRDLAETVLRLVAADARGTVHVTNSGCCSWYDLAVATLELAGVEHPVAAVDSAAFPAGARRPAFSQLRSMRLAEFGLEPPRPWRAGLQAYLIEKGVLPAVAPVSTPSLIRSQS